MNTPGVPRFLGSCALDRRLRATCAARELRWQASQASCGLGGVWRACSRAYYARPTMFRRFLIPPFVDLCHVAISTMREKPRVTHESMWRRVVRRVRCARVRSLSLHMAACGPCVPLMCPLHLSVFCVEEAHTRRARGPRQTPFLAKINHPTAWSDDAAFAGFLEASLRQPSLLYQPRSRKSLSVCRSVCVSASALGLSSLFTHST